MVISKGIRKFVKVAERVVKVVNTLNLWRKKPQAPVPLLPPSFSLVTFFDDLGGTRVVFTTLSLALVRAGNKSRQLWKKSFVNMHSVHAEIEGKAASGHGVTQHDHPQVARGTRGPVSQEPITPDVQRDLFLPLCLAFWSLVRPPSEPGQYKHVYLFVFLCWCGL